jgi:hypothetical protein
MYASVPSIRFVRSDFVGMFCRVPVGRVGGKTENFVRDNCDFVTPCEQMRRLTQPQI